MDYEELYNIVAQHKAYHIIAPTNYAFIYDIEKNLPFFSKITDEIQNSTYYPIIAPTYLKIYRWGHEQNIKTIVTQKLPPLLCRDFLNKFILPERCYYYSDKNSNTVVVCTLNSLKADDVEKDIQELLHPLCQKIYFTSCMPVKYDYAHQKIVWGEE